MARADAAASGGERGLRSGVGRSAQKRQRPRDDELAEWSHRLIEALHGGADARAALVALCDAIREHLPCDRVQVWRGDVAQSGMRAVVASGYPEGEARRLAALVAPMPTMTFVHYDFLREKVVFVPETSAIDDPFARVAFTDFGIETAALMLLERVDRPIGALQLSWCRRAGALLPAPEVVESIRLHASLALDFLARTDDALRLSDTLSQTAILLGSIHDPDELLRTTAARIAEAVGCDFATVHLLEDDGLTLARVAQHGLVTPDEFLRRTTVDPEVLARAVEGTQDGVFEVPDTRLHATHAALLDVFEIASFFSVPLVQEGRLSGFLTLGYRERTGHFSRRQIALAQGVVHHALAALRNARTMQSLREVNQVKSDFIAAVSHDLRTPLHVLIGYSDMLLESAAGGLNAGQADLVTRLRAGALRFRDLINDVLDVARLDAGKGASVWEPVVMSDLCREMHAELEPLRRPEVALRCSIGGIEVLGDAAKIKTILRNLLSNALKFTRRGEVEVRAEPSRPDELVLRVRDTGPGIRTEDRPRIFDMFQQGEAGLRAGGSGLGLGLYLVKRVTAMLGGSVALISGDPGNTVFEVRLPVKSLPSPPDARP